MKRYQRSRHAECVIFFVLALAISSIAIAQLQPPAPSEPEVRKTQQQVPTRTDHGTAADLRGTAEAPVVVKVLPTIKTGDEAKQESEDRKESGV